MSYTPNTPQSTTSAYGVNSYSATTGPLWSGDIFTGAGEQNDYNYASVNLQVDEVGKLTFQFSQDGTNWSNYPVTQFDVASGINEIHGVFKGTRYIRPYFSGSTGTRTYFRLRTMYSYAPVILSAPINQSISSDSDATITRAIGIGENPTGEFNNQKADGLGFSTTSLLTSGQTYSSGVLSLVGYTQVQTDILSVGANGTTTIRFYEDAAGTNLLRTLTSTYTSGDGFKLLSAPAFTPYVKYDFTCTSTGQTQFYFDTKFTTKSISGQIINLTDNIAGGMVANLGRNIIAGQEPNGTFTNQKIDGVAFRTESALASGATYTSTLTSTEGFSQIETHLYSNVAGTLVGRWYNDVNKTTLLRTFTRPYAGDEVGSVTYFSSPIFGPYIEYTYTNGSVGQSSFFLDFHPRIKSISGQVLGLNDFIPTGVVANLGRNVIVGQTDGNFFQNISSTSEGHLGVSIQNPRSAFGELSMIQPTPVAQIDFVYGLNSQTTITASTSGGSASTSASTLVLTTDANINSVSMVTSTRYLKYRPGQGAMGRFTAVFDTGTANSFQYAGLGTPSLNNGFFFGYSGSTFGIIHRNNSVPTFYPQTDWSEDVCDGSGGAYNKSGFNLNQQKGNVYQIKYQYLGFGNIYFFIENQSNGQLFVVHQIKYPNNNTSTSLQQPSLNLLWRVENTTNTSVLTLKAGSGALFVEGERRLLGPKYGIDNNKSLTAGVSTSLLALRSATTYNGVNNRAQVRIRTISLAADMSTTNSGIQVLQVHKNATLGGVPVYTPINGTTADNGDTITNGGSVISYDTAGTTVTPVTTGSTPSWVVFNTNVARNSNVVVDVSDLDIFISPGDVLIFMIKTINGGTQQANVSINWVEDI